MQEVRNGRPQIEVHFAVRQAKKDGPLGRIGPQHLVKDRLK
jgi:hypothetical protein